MNLLWVFFKNIFQLWKYLPKSRRNPRGCSYSWGEQSSSSDTVVISDIDGTSHTVEAILIYYKVWASLPPRSEGQQKPVPSFRLTKVRHGLVPGHPVRFICEWEFEPGSLPNYYPTYTHLLSKYKRPNIHLAENTGEVKNVCNLQLLWDLSETGLWAWVHQRLLRILSGHTATLVQREVMQRRSETYTFEPNIIFS